MKDYKVEIISALEKAVLELKDKIQIGAVDAEIPLPFATCSNILESPIRTLSGIAGCEISFELSVYHNKVSSVETLKQKVITTLDSKDILSKRCYLKSSEYAFYQDYNIHSYTITFKII